MKVCNNCNYQNQNDANFCSNCNTPFLQSNKLSNTSIIAIVAVVCIIASCVLCGIIGAIGNKDTSRQTVKIEKTPITTPSKPTPPRTFEELARETKSWIESKEDTYSDDDIKDIDIVMSDLRAIPKDSKNYKQAQKLLEQLTDRVSYVVAEKVILGERPSKIDLKLAFNHYLQNRLNDYSSSEYVGYTAASKVYVKKEPFWESILTLRAKNAFGAYVLQDYKMYLRNKEVIAMEEIK